MGTCHELPWTQFSVTKEKLQRIVLGVSKRAVQQIAKKRLQQERKIVGSQFPLNFQYPMNLISEQVRRTLYHSSKPVSPLPTSKRRLTPAHKIYDRISHDPTVDEELFTVGYLDRHTGMEEVAFNRFVTQEKEKFYNTSVPFHRIRYFKYKDHIAWDRDSRVDLLDGNKFLEIV